MSRFEAMFLVGMVILAIGAFVLIDKADRNQSRYTKFVGVCEYQGGEVWVKNGEDFCLKFNDDRTNAVVIMKGPK